MVFAIPSQSQDRIAVAGDWHANTAFATRVIQHLAARDIDTILHVGDFCIYPNDRFGARFLDSVDKLCRKLGITIWVTPGNHEDWSYLDQLNRDRPDDEVHWVRKNIAVIRRGAHFTFPPFDDVVFASLGGAPSVNLHDLTPWVSWFPTEIYTIGDVQRLIDSGPVDVLLAHDVCNGSTSAVERMLATNPYGWPQDALLYAAQGRALLDEVRDALQPKLWLHGHYHVSQISQSEETVFTALAHDHGPLDQNYALVDVINFSVEHAGVSFLLN